MKEKIADVGIIISGVFCSLVGTYEQFKNTRLEQQQCFWVFILKLLFL